MSKNKGSSFDSLKNLKQKLVIEEREKGKPVRQAIVNDEQDLLARAMEGVQPLKERPAPRPKAKIKNRVDGDPPKNLLGSDLVGTEHVEGRATDCSNLDLSKLRNGDFAIQGKIDLHGENRDEAHAVLVRFFSDSIRLGHRCVLVICGRGLRSPGGRPVLKELLVQWLLQGQLGHNVFAFSSAKACDGGAGAIVVLLRRNPRRPA